MRQVRNLFLFCILLSSLALSARAAGPEGAIPGIGPTGPVQKLHTDFEFTEGPLAIGEDTYFTDIPKERIYKLDGDGKLAVFREHSNFSNGLFHHRGKNEIVACEMKSGNIVAISLDGKKIRPVAEKYNGDRFNAPNDLTIDRAGGVYFTDPHFRAPMPLPQKKTCVYYIDPEGKVARLIDDLKAPNGVELSPDEKTLYVIPSQSADMMAYPIEGPGKLGAGKVFCKLEQAEGQKDGGGDGLTVDSKGNLYITSRVGIQVFDPQGKPLGILRSPQLIPEQPSNCVFGGKDKKTLCITARKSLYALPMEAAGHVFPAGKAAD
jgi:gluconolactonase